MVTERDGFLYCERPGCKASFGIEGFPSLKNAKKVAREHERNNNLHKKPVHEKYKLRSSVLRAKDFKVSLQTPRQNPPGREINKQP